MSDFAETRAGWAVCDDCRKVVARGRIRIRLADWVHGGGIADGELVTRCCQHHDKCRKWGESDTLQHDSFIIFSGSGRIGSIRVSSMSAEVYIDVVDNGITERLSEEAARIRKSRGFPG